MVTGGHIDVNSCVLNEKIYATLHKEIGYACTHFLKNNF